MWGVQKTKDLSNMGETALSDHKLGKTHIENVKKIRNFFSIKKATAASPVLDTRQFSVSGSSLQTIDGAVTDDLVDNAEIRKSLKCEMASCSNKSNIAMSDLFPVMFPDSHNCSKVSAWSWQVTLFN